MVIYMLDHIYKRCLSFLILDHHGHGYQMRIVQKANVLGSITNIIIQIVMRTPYKLKQ